MAIELKLPNMLQLLAFVRVYRFRELGARVPGEVLSLYANPCLYSFSTLWFENVRESTFEEPSVRFELACFLRPSWKTGGVWPNEKSHSPVQFKLGLDRLTFGCISLAPNQKKVLGYFIL